MIPIGLDFDKIKITFLMDLLNGNIDGSQSKWFVNDHYYKMDDIGYEGNLTVENIILNENHNLFKINFYDKIKGIYNEKQKGEDYEL